jgi:hypothetical protein
MKIREKVYLVFNRWQEEVGIITGISRADATKKARELICEFPMIKEIKKEN